ncbi:hypothetical protein ACFRFK_34735, partial [Streptomyces sp. NPDC056689]
HHPRPHRRPAHRHGPVRRRELLQPAGAVALGGALAAAEPLVAAVRGVLYERCLPLATADLEITTTVTGPDAGLLGAGLTALRHNLPTAPVPQEESASA